MKTLTISKLNDCCTALLPLLALLAPACGTAAAQASAASLKAQLGEEILPAQVAALQLRDYVLRRIAAPPKPRNAASWSAEAAKLRAKMLETAFHGWPKASLVQSAVFEMIKKVEAGLPWNG